MNLRKGIVITALICVILLSIITKIGQIIDYPYLLDGDPYFHGLIMDSIIEKGEMPITIPHQVPETTLFYPLGFHLELAIINIFTGIGSLDLLRYVGAFIAGLLSLQMYVILKKIFKSDVIAIFGGTLMAISPVLTDRLSIGLSENLFLVSILFTIYLSLYFQESHSFTLLLFLTVVIGSSFFIHFSSYFSLPLLIYLWGYFIVLIFLRRKFFFALVIFLLGGLSILSVVFYFPQIISVMKSFANTGVANPEFLPPPTFWQWQTQLSYYAIPVLIISIIALLINFRKEMLVRRYYTPIIIFTLVIFSFLEVLPLFKIYNLLPFRAFTYFILCGILLMSYFFYRFKVYPIVFASIIAFIVITHPFRASGWDKDLTLLEHEGIFNLKNIEENSLIVTQPINGRMIIFFTRRSTVSDAARELFFAENSDVFISGIKSFGQYDAYYVLISKHKLTPEYNKGWVRPWAAVGLNWNIFDQSKFKVVYENNDVVIYKLKNSL